mmetsp:Transcript_13225/g.49442  ORF Transcript_13225/g.49442 Transcript_13225/m.49442 type:complete len:270 (-) Transcript_13225:1204-2013(-)
MKRPLDRAAIPTGTSLRGAVRSCTLSFPRFPFLNPTGFPPPPRLPKLDAAVRAAASNRTSPNASPSASSSESSSRPGAPPPPPHMAKGDTCCNSRHGFSPKPEVRPGDLRRTAPSDPTPVSIAGGVLGSGSIVVTGDDFFREPRLRSARGRSPPPREIQFQLGEVTGSSSSSSSSYESRGPRDDDRARSLESREPPKRRLVGDARDDDRVLPSSSSSLLPYALPPTGRCRRRFFRNENTPIMCPAFSTASAVNARATKMPPRKTSRVEN